jgi:hypothetical protein
VLMQVGEILQNKNNFIAQLKLNLKLQFN